MPNIAEKKTICFFKNISQNKKEVATEDGGEDGEVGTQLVLRSNCRSPAPVSAAAAAGRAPS